ncbi:MAG: UvrD-helicase domain-containing protein [Prevotellaceae bacterium]|nr:UvrD-helicase domain-containing protein [Candidatus Minthosoma caballi]
MSNYLDSFNPPQREAVEYCDGPSLVIAGAGSGKTRVLTNKIAYLMEHGYEPWSILALTFTNKAANEMKERIAKIVGTECARHLWMGTFHSIFLHILRIEHEHIGFSSSFTIYDAADSKSLVKSIIKEMELDDKKYKPGDVLNNISNCKNQLITAEQYVNNPANMQSDARRNTPMLGKIFERYCSRCKQSDAMDFDDILLYTYLLFANNPEVKDKWETRFKYVLVDEYQDTNFAQHQIVWQLTEHRQHVCVVGDDAQSIYSFRGANIDNILTFTNQYTDAKLFKLEQNYRSTQNIVEAANSLIGKNSRQIRKEVFSENDRGELIHVLSTQSDIEEVRVVVNNIKKLKKLDGGEFSDFAILYRTNAQSRVFEESLRKEGIPYRIFGGLSFYQRKEIKDIIAYFRLVVNHNDEEAFRRIINYPARGIGQTTVQKIVQQANDHETSLWNVISDPITYGLSVNKGTATKIQQFHDLIEGFAEQAAMLPADQIGTLIVKQSGIINDIYQDSTAENLARQENVEELVNGLQDFVQQRMEEGNENVSLIDYLSEVSLLSEIDTDKGDDEHKVTLMTIHSAKGLEFGTVFVVGMEDGLFPSQMSSGSPREMEEERRLFYVAITRAKTRCFVSYAQCRLRYGTMEFGAPSRFLSDIDQKYLDKQQTMASQRKNASDDIDLPWKRRNRLFDDEGFIGANRDSERSRFSSSSGQGYSAHTQGYSSSNGHSQPSPNRQIYSSSSSSPYSSAPRPFTPTVPKQETQMPQGMRKITKIVTEKSKTDSVPSTSTAQGTLAVGAHILHERFGRGEVMKIEGGGEMTKATIQFENVGSKQLLLKYAKFKIID